MHALTIVARNYLPQARVLAATFLEHHPDATFATLVIDGDEHDRRSCGAGDVLLIDDIGLPRDEWRRMAAIYDVMELATALKAAALRHVLCTRAETGQAVAYIDPDVQVMAPFHDVFEHAAASGIALTPHLVEPMPRDGHTPDEAAFRHAGIFNLGFACVGHDGLPCLDWWHERLRTDAVVDLPNALFTDQRWVDWVPSLFPLTVERDPGLNVAYWNVHERHLTRDAGGTLRANGQPLRFMHFSGYDPAMPWQLSRHAGPKPRRLLSDEPLLRELCDDYADRLRRNGFGERTTEYGFAHAADGTRLDRRVRSALRDAWIAAERGDGPPPPDVFDAVEADAFARWVRPPTVRPVDDREPLGWNLVGHHRSDGRVGAGVRLLGAAVRGLGVPVTDVDVDRGDVLERRDSIVCLDPHDAGRVVERLELDATRHGHARRIGLWWWDHPTFPPHMAGAAHFLDEVWVTSEMARAVVEPALGVPVRTVRLPVPVPAAPPALRRDQLGVPDGFVFTCRHEVGRSAEQQHTAGTIEAYRRAFGPDDGAVLLIEAIGGRDLPAQLERARWAAAGRADIVIADGSRSPLERLAVLAVSDCVVSLDRCGDFALHLAQAMAAGTAVLATGHAGHRELMDDDCAVLVPFEPRPVCVDGEPTDAMWACPRLDDAAAAMRRLFDRPEQAKRLGAAGRDRITRTHSVDQAAAILRPLLQPAFTTSDEPLGAV